MLMTSVVINFHMITSVGRKGEKEGNGG
jgi:hypothetical protein